jgi:hypothetical protein
VALVKGMAMIAALWAALFLVALIAVTSFGLVLILARRLRKVTAKVNAVLPDEESRLPSAGTPVPQFQARTADGAEVTQEELNGPDRVIAFLTTDCGSCHDQLPALRDGYPEEWRTPLVVVIGAPAERTAMVQSLNGRAIVVEEEGRGPLASAFEIHEFPGILLVQDGYVRASGHGLAGVVKAAAPA